MKKAFAKLKADVKGSTEYGRQRKEGFHHEDHVKELIAFLENLQKRWKKNHKAINTFIKSMGSTVASVDNLRDTTCELLKYEIDNGAEGQLPDFVTAHQENSKHWHSFVEKLYVMEGNSTTLNARIETTMKQVDEANHLVATLEAYKKNNDERYLNSKTNYDKLISEIVASITSIKEDQSKITQELLSSWAEAYQHFGGLITAGLADIPIAAQ